MSSSKSVSSTQARNHALRKPTKLLKELEEAEDYHKLKDYYYDRYMSQLRDKILELDDKTSASLSKNTSSSQRKVKLNTKPVRTSNIPKSNKLTMLEAEHKLSKAGFLQTEDELTEFRNGISSAEDVNKYTDDFVAKKNASKSRLSTSRKGERPLSKIAETRENTPYKSSRPSSKSIPKKQMDTDLNPLSGNKKLSPADIARAAAAALEKRCPRMDVPDLHCLRPDLDDSDGESEIAREETRERRKDEYSSHVAYLREMYQRAQANSAQAKRIIDGRNGDILQVERKSNLISDLKNVCRLISPAAPSTAGRKAQRVEFNDAISPTYDPSYDVPDLSDTEGESFTEVQEDRVSQWRQETQQPTSGIRQPFNVFTPIEEEPSSPPIDQKSDLVHNSALVPYSNRNEEQETDIRQPILAIEGEDSGTNGQPLTLTGAEAELKVIEAKAVSTYWPNYLSVGESKFARKETSEIESH